MARHQFVVITLAAIALVSSFWFLLDVLGAAITADRPSAWLRLKTGSTIFRKTVQPHTVYGYLSDTPASDPSTLAEFHLTQYVLAPAIIRPSPHENLVIVNYHSKDMDMKLLSPIICALSD